MYITGKYYYALLKSPVEFWGWRQKLGSSNQQKKYLFYIDEVDRMLVYLIKRVAICLPMCEGQVYTGAMKMFRRLISKLHFSERKRRRVYCEKVKI